MSERLILISCVHLQRRFEEFRDEFVERGYSAQLPTVTQQLPEEWLFENIESFDGVIAGDDPFTRRVLEKGRSGRLRALVKWGVGVDAIDGHAVRELGISFSNTPGAFSHEVADVALGYVLMLARRLHEVDRAVRAGGWFKPEGVSLKGKTLGIIGLGGIGRALAERGSALGMEVVGSDVEGVADSGPWTRLAQKDVLRRSHFLVLTCSLTPQTRHLINEDTLKLLPDGAHLINVARGPLVDEAALWEALNAGRLAGAALDVFEIEPLPEDSRLRRCERCVFGSHNASNTREAVDRVNRLAVNTLFRLLDGE